MDAEIINIIIPSIFFFVAFFLAFLLAELLIILALNRILFHYWGFTVNVLIRSKVRHGKTLQKVTLVMIVALLAVLLKFTALIEILSIASLEIKVLAAETLLAMVLVYLITTRRLTKLEVEKSIHRYLYIYLSMIVFVLTLILANKSYADYKDFINANVTAVVRGVEHKMNHYKKNRLLHGFRAMLYRGECAKTNYLEKPGDSDIKHFVLVAKNEDLARTKNSPEDNRDPARYLKGRDCSNGVETFLLTDYGEWYWVINP